VTSTPVIDRTRGAIYVIAVSQGRRRGIIFTGSMRWI